MIRITATTTQADLICRRDESEFTNAVGRLAKESADMLLPEPVMRPRSQTAVPVKQRAIEVRAAQRSWNGQQ